MQLLFCCYCIVRSFSFVCVWMNLYVRFSFSKGKCGYGCARAHTHSRSVFLISCRVIFAASISECVEKLANKILWTMINKEIHFPLLIITNSTWNSHSFSRIVGIEYEIKVLFFTPSRTGKYEKKYARTHTVIVTRLERANESRWQRSTAKVCFAQLHAKFYLSIKEDWMNEWEKNNKRKMEKNRNKKNWKK